MNTPRTRLVRTQADMVDTAAAVWAVTLIVGGVFAAFALRGHTVAWFVALAVAGALAFTGYATASLLAATARLLADHTDSE